MPPRRTWLAKFADSFRGIWTGIRGERNFSIHLTVAIAVVALAAVLRVSLAEWCLLILCIAAVLAAELFNTALEHLARQVDRDRSPNLGAALDMASGAVLLAAIAAAIVGALVFGYRLGLLAQWWS